MRKNSELKPPFVPWKRGLFASQETQTSRNERAKADQALDGSKDTIVKAIVRVKEQYAAVYTRDGRFRTILTREDMKLSGWLVRLIDDDPYVPIYVADADDIDGIIERIGHPTHSRLQKAFLSRYHEHVRR